MSGHYSEDETVAAVARLTQAQLQTFVKLEIVQPLHTKGGVAYRQVDLVRLELLCELSEDFDLQDDALSVVISLIDQLHGVRSELRTVLAVLAAEPKEVQVRIGAALHQASPGSR
jgi:chaperone modulatory protein CbpM